MKLDFTNFLYALSYALDAVEQEITGSTVEHGKRVAILSYLCLKNSNLTDLEKVNLVCCAILHDNAIAEYLNEEFGILHNNCNPELIKIRNEYGALSVHSYIGEKNISKLPLYGDIKNVILWHHENADGSGPFRKTENETNISSQVIHLTDLIDVSYFLPELLDNEFQIVRDYVRQNTGTLFSHAAADLFLNNVTWEDIKSLQKEGPLALLQKNIPVIEKEYSDNELTQIALFFAKIVDYKSSFTKDHSIGVAQKAQAMAEHYNFDHEKLIRFSFAAALHDIGKMVVGNDILEKPDKLDAHEFSKMKNHAAETYKILSTIKGFEDITEWAANHHEKLDGTGYSRRLPAEKQTFEDRLMACIDIYQALTEKRPYKDGLSHRRSISIMKEMAAECKIEASIVDDMDLVFGKNATLEEDDFENKKLTTKRWRCKVCGFVYEGDTPPANCPVCDSDMDEFELL